MQASVTKLGSISDYKLEWSVDDDKVASIAADPDDQTKAVITGLADGTTTFRVTDGFLVAEGKVLVEKDKRVNVLSDIQILSKNNTVTSNNYEYEKYIDPEKKEITIYVPTGGNASNAGICAYPEFSDGKTVTKAVLDWTNVRDGSAKTCEMDDNGRLNTNFYQAPYIAEGNDSGSWKMTLTTDQGEEEVWTITALRFNSLKGLAIAPKNGGIANLSPTFKNSVYEYQTAVSTGAGSLDLTLTRTCEGDQIKVNGEEVELNESGVGTYSLSLKEGVQKAVITVSADGVRDIEYVLYVVGLAPVKVTMVTDPEDAIVNLTDLEGNRQVPTNGVYLLAEGTYNYTVTAKGYVAKKGSVTVSGSDPITIKESLEAAKPNTELKDFEADWPSYSRNADNGDNNAVINAPTPTQKDMVSVKWVKQPGQELSAGAVSAGIIVNDHLYAYAGKMLFMMDKDTGEILNSHQMTAQTGYQYMPPVYGDGMIFVAQTGGAVEAFNADTLEPLWRYVDPLGGSCRSQMRYADGYVYVGYFNSPNSNSNWVCLSATDEDPTKGNEEKLATWTMAHKSGFYFAGCYTSDKYVFITSDGGNGAYEGTLYCLDKESGYVLQKIPVQGDIRGNVVYYENRLFLTTTKGYVYAFNLNDEGMIDTENTIEPLYLGGRSTNTPVIFNNRLYFACAAGSVGPYPDAGIYVVDINPDNGALSLAYQVKATGNCQASGIISTAEFDSTGYVYVYFTSNTSDGSIYMIKDKAGMTEADPSSGKFWSPDHSQFCLHRLWADSDGMLYYTNDGGYMYALKTTYLGLKGIQAEGGNAVVDDGAFNELDSEHTIVVDPDTESLKLTFTTEEGAQVWINDQTVTAAYEVALKDGEAEIVAKVVNGKNSREYTIHVVARSNDATLTSLAVTETEAYSADTVLTPEFAPETLEYTHLNNEVPAVYVWPEEADKATLSVIAVSGVKDCAEGTELTKETVDGRNRYKVTFADDTHCAVIKLKVTAEDQKTVKEYTLNLKPADKTAPLVTEIEVGSRKADSAVLSYTSSEAATGYYVVSAKDAEETDAAAIKENGTQFEAAEGKNTTDLKNLTKEAAKIQFVLEDESGNVSAVYTAEVPEYISLEGISVDPESGSLNQKNPTLDVKLTLNPENPTELPEITWKSENEDIATVTVDPEHPTQAVITGVGDGTAVITVTAGEFTKTVTVQADMTCVDLKSADVTFTNRTDTTADMTVKAPEACTVSYVVKAADAEAPADSDALLKDAEVQTLTITAEDLEAGKTVTLENLTKDAAKVYLAATDAAGNVTAVLAVDVPAQDRIPGDVNEDGSVDIMDAALIIDMIKGNEEPNLALGDIDGSGEIDIMDVAALIDLIKAGN